MNEKTKETTLKYAAFLKINETTHFINSDDFKVIDNLIRAVCKAENVQPTFSNGNDHTIYLTDSFGDPLGEIVTYPSQTVNSRKQQKAA